MRSAIVTYLRGNVKLEIRGGSQQRLLNLLMERQLQIWNIKPRADGTVQLYISVSDFFQLRELLKQTGCRVHILDRHGLPFFLARLGRRKAFVGGLLLFVLGMYLLSSVVWEVSVEGNERIERHAVIEAAKKHGIYALQWKFRLSDPADLSRKLMAELPEASWIGVRISGTKITIKVVESTRPDAPPLLSPRHLISTSDAVVTDIYTEQGRPLVQPNMRVKRGDVLISGLMGNEQHQQSVVAKGTVYGLVWYEYAIEVPLKLKHKAYSGEVQSKKYINIGNWRIQVSGFGKRGFEKEEIIARRSDVHWRSFKLPLGWTGEKVMEVRIVEQEISQEQAKNIGLQQAKADLLQVAGYDAQIRGEKILHERSESGKVYMKVLFEVNQQITMEQPIVPSMEEDHNQGE